MEKEFVVVKQEDNETAWIRIDEIVMAYRRKEPMSSDNEIMWTFATRNRGLYRVTVQSNGCVDQVYTHTFNKKAVQ